MDLENKDIEQIIRQLDAGLREIFEGDNFQKYLLFLARPFCRFWPNKNP